MLSQRELFLYLKTKKLIPLKAVSHPDQAQNSSLMNIKRFETPSKSSSAILSVRLSTVDK
jgi:hypothetical protein